MYLLRLLHWQARSLHLSALSSPRRVLLFSNSNSTSPDLRLFPRSLGANNNNPYLNPGHWENLTR